MKLFLERIHASLLIQLSHSDDSLIPYVGSCIYRKELGQPRATPRPVEIMEQNS